MQTRIVWCEPSGRTGWRGWAIGAILAAALGGCGRGDSATFKNWAPPDEPFMLEQGSANAFDAYAIASNKLDSVDPKLLSRTTFYPAQKEAAQKEVAKVMPLVIGGTRKACDFKFKPRALGEKPPFQANWRFIGRVLTWQIEDAVKAENYDRAIERFGILTRFGFDLLGGSMSDASLGATMINDARAAIAPSMNKMGAGQLNVLASQASKALKRKPALAVCVNHEFENARMALQQVQDAYLAKKLGDLRKVLGEELADDLVVLGNMKQPAAAEMFAKLGAELDDRKEAMFTMAKQPVAKRKMPKFKWGRRLRLLRAVIVGGLQPYTFIDDISARTRLLALESSLLAKVKSKQGLPRSLKNYEKSLTTDPYSGFPFIYRADGNRYLVYSVGKDLKDDGGETDNSFTVPDLRIERPSTN